MTFKIAPFTTIDGIGAASGLVFNDKNLFIIGDNSGFLFQYNIQNSNLLKHPLVDNASDSIIKKDKPDFESITLHEDKLLIFGSGSTKKRENRVKFDLKNQETSTKDISKLYGKLKQKANFTDDDLNIEGVFYFNNNQYYVNRGNSQTAPNGIFVYNKEFDNVFFKSFELPIINQVMVSFTDAICHKNKIYFLACAENTTDTYNDGEIYGSVFGIIDLLTFEIEKTIQITDNQKFEGLTIYSEQENEINFLLCEDNDTEDLQSTIYQLTINKNHEFEL